MEMLSLIVGIVSLVVGVVSIVLAVVSMDSSKKAESQSQHNFEKTQELLRQNYEVTQKVLQENYDKTKELLAQIDKKAAVIDSVVQRNQEQMMTTLTNIVNETVLPKKPDYGEQLGVEFMKGLMANPSAMSDSIEGLNALLQMAEKMPKKE
ncbi:MAG: hypothetical protein E7287_07200 [Lachnospiraceae bacterium]|nr:hypothetical protein [Lachnospiraceae bacterium]